MPDAVAAATAAASLEAAVSETEEELCNPQQRDERLIEIKPHFDSMSAGRARCECRMCVHKEKQREMEQQEYMRNLRAEIDQRYACGRLDHRGRSYPGRPFTSI